MNYQPEKIDLEYLAVVRKFVAKEILTGLLAREKNHEFPLDLITKIWELGIMNVSIPAAIKGYDLNIVLGAEIIAALSYGDSGLSTSAMCNDLANCVIAQEGTAAQQEKFLAPFVEKPLLASFCLTEPNAGSDNSAMTTTLAKADQGKYILNGTKCFITNASYASQLTVFCKLGRPTNQLLSCVVVPLPREDFPSPSDISQGRTIELPEGGCVIIGKPEDKLGQRLSNTASVTFEDVVVREEQIIGDRRQGFKYLIAVLDFARPMVAAIGVGVARRALDLTLAYTRERRQFGSRLCDLPIARDSLVKMWKKVELAQMALLTATHKVRTQDPDRSLYASLAKNTAAEAALFCTQEGLHLHGGYGFMEEYEIAKLARDAHIIDIYEGVREVQDMIIGRELV